MQNLIDKIRQDKKLTIVLLIGVVGVIMLIFVRSDSETKTSPEKSEMTTAANYSTYDIEKIFENKLTEIISQINGAGKTSVVVSVASSGEYVYAKNIKTENDNDSMSEDSEIVIYESQNGADEGLVISIKSPDVIGVAIVCEGGESSVVKAEITKLVTSLFGIGADRVYVGNKVIN